VEKVEIDGVAGPQAAKRTEAATWRRAVFLTGRWRVSAWNLSHSSWRCAAMGAPCFRLDLLIGWEKILRHWHIAASCTVKHLL